MAEALKQLAGDDTARKFTEYQTELRREKHRDERTKALRKRNQQRFSVSTDIRNRATQAFWAMHVEAMNWSGMNVRPTPLRCSCRRIRGVNGVTDWIAARSQLTTARIFTPPPVRPLALVPGTQLPKGA
ncbi:hypothetical protein [Bradyrhizobium genosp. P]|uniref:hypothetical protein n=1 Tax=Bradyrhizobium genosp. P TaxID=83641 RepID=UPI003CEF1B32